MAVLQLALTGCDNVGYLFAPPQTPGASGDVTNSPLVGEWESIVTVSVGSDVQTVTTNWIFRSDRSCQFHEIVQSVAQSDSTVELRTCTFIDQTTRVSITWDDTGATDEFLYSFANLDPNRLILRGREYQRIE